ncbi:MAG: hypothetical protein IRZ15_14890 [Bryobacteraceae bacterium]|nr:hypothetical protein [Bryobacteraceae bacterium]
MKALGIAQAKGLAGALKLPMLWSIGVGPEMIRTVTAGDLASVDVFAIAPRP